MTGLSADASARELTVLAWRRTLLRWAVVAIIGARLFAGEFGPVAVIAALVVVAGAAFLNFAASRAHSEVRTGSGLPTPHLPDALSSPRVRLGLMLTGTLIVAGLALLWLTFR